MSCRCHQSSLPSFTAFEEKHTIFRNKCLQKDNASQLQSCTVTCNGDKCKKGGTKISINSEQICSSQRPESNDAFTVSPTLSEHLKLSESRCQLSSDAMERCLRFKSYGEVLKLNEETSLNKTEIINTKNNMKKDDKIKREGAGFQCVHCGKKIASKDKFKLHLRIHMDERPYTCHICGKQFRVPAGLNRHIRDVHVGLKEFSCDICSRTFASKATRDDHRRVHTGERPYVCDSCGKTFKTKACLYTHNKSHSDSYPFPCSYCSKGFRSRPSLLAHILTHTGERPFNCDICGKGFRIKYELSRHKLVHSEQKPFVCAECGLCFRQKRYLKNHDMIHH